jgi:hypothetical protein
MEHIVNYDSFMNESAGIHPAIFKELKAYFENSGKKANFEGAKKEILSKMPKWNLSKEDFEEAKKEFLK